MKPGYNWHADCHDEYRAAGNYRKPTLARDGYVCAKCSRLRNWAVLADPATGQLRGWVRVVHAFRLDFNPTRRVDADHILAMGGPTGTHAPHNMQILCIPHHKAKTRRDVAEMRGTRRRHHPRITIGWIAVTLTALWILKGVATGLTGGDATTGPGAGAGRALRTALPGVATITVLALAAWAVLSYRKRVLTRLRTALGPTLGDAVTHKKMVKVNHWGKVPGAALPLPTTLTINYPSGFPDNDADKLNDVEARVAAKLGWNSILGRWNTQKDTATLSTPNPFVAAKPTPWPLASGGPRTLWDDIPIGLDTKAGKQTVNLIERSMLIGGEPGAGKSVGLSMLLAVAAADADATLYLVDGKRVELAAWAPAAAASGGRVVYTAADFKALLTEVQAVMDTRYEILAMEGRRKIRRGDGLGLIVLAVDELATFTAGGDKKSRDELVELLRDILSRGRAAGIITIAATQRPSADVVPTQIRDLFGFRWALRCTTPTSSDMVLGAGWSSQGFTASRVDTAARGVGYLLAEGSKPVLMRSYYIDDGTLEHLAEDALRVREEVGVPVEAPGAHPA